jgi:methyltransferase
MTVFYAVIALVIAERLIELVVAQRNTTYLLSIGAVETGRKHYPLIVLLHAAWLISFIVFIPADRTPNWWLLGMFFALQPVRYWVLTTLGRRWTTRIIVLPDSPPLTTGPFRWMRHPNYLVVVCEILLLPLAFGAWELAVGFSVLNAAILTHRIRVENLTLMGPASQIRE